MHFFLWNNDNSLERPLGFKNISFYAESIPYYYDFFFFHEVGYGKSLLSLFLFSFFFKTVLFIYWLRCLCCCKRTFSIRGAWASRCGGSLVAEHKVQSMQPQQLWCSGVLAHDMWDLPGSGIEPVSPALAGRLLTTGPPGKSCIILHIWMIQFLYILISIWCCHYLISALLMCM